MLPQAMELRIIRLEENFYFLEEQLKKLDKQTAEQQAQIDSLTKSLKEIAGRLMEMQEILNEAHGHAGSAGYVDETPPHHVPRLW